MTDSVLHPDVLIVGAGPAGSAAAIHAAQHGFSVLLVDAQTFPRDKTCGDGLTPRAIHQLERLGIDVTSNYHNNGLQLHGFGGSQEVPWPDSSFGRIGSAMPRTSFDALLLEYAQRRPEVNFIGGHAAVDVEFGAAGIEEVLLECGTRIQPRWVIVADGVRSTFGKLLGRTWHRGEVYGIAARSYCDTPRHDDPWIHSHLELRDQDGQIQPGYGWIFPLANGQANVGCGALSTDKRPAKINTKKLLQHYAASCGEGWEFGTPQQVTSALLPMGGAVTGVAGPNWALIGDAAACVNPLNGEGIDYGLETAGLAVDLIAGIGTIGLTSQWPVVLREHYGAAFLLARTLAKLLTYPQFLPATGPLALRGASGRLIMPAAARLMGNLVTEEDRDLVAKLWRGAGRGLLQLQKQRPLWS